MGIFKKLLLLLFSSVFISFTVYSQQTIDIKGFVVTPDSSKIDYCNVILYNSADSTIANGNVCYNGELYINPNKTGDYRLVITSLGYEDITLNLALSSSVHLGTIMMSPVSSNEVIVYGKAAKIKYEKGVTKVLVGNSSLTHLPTVTEILGRAPGVKNEQEGISVIGRGVPEIYIDGVKVNSYTEVEMLQPSEIVSFEVDKNPSSQYAADITSVIRIKTKRGATEGFSTQVYNRSIFGRKYSDVIGIQANLNKGKFRNFVGYDLYDTDNLDYIDSYDYNYLPSGTIKSNESSTINYRGIYNNLLYGAGYRFNDKHDLSIQYHLTNRSYKLDKKSEQLTKLDDKEKDKLTNFKNGESYSLRNIFSGTYIYKPSENHKLSLSGDYILSNYGDTDNILEKSHILDNENKILINNKIKSDTYTFKLDYELKIKKIEFLLGARYSNSSNYLNTNTDYFSGLTNSTFYNDIDDNNYAFYFTFNHNFDAFGYGLGLRNETSMYKAISNGTTIKNSTKNNLFPSVSIYTNDMSKKVDISLNYTSKIERPTFSQLNPAKSYLNNLSFNTGNPLLNPTIKHNVTLDFTFWKNLSLYASYDYNIDPVLLTGVQDPEKPEIILFTPMNVDKSKEWNAGVSYNNKWKWFGLSSDVSITLPNVEIPFLGSVLKRDKPYCYVQISTDFDLTKTTFLSLSWDYQSESIDLMTDLSAIHDLSMSLSQYLFKKRVQINLAVNNILGMSYNDWFDKYGYVETGQYNSKRDTRFVKLTVRYNFNNYKNSYNRKSNSDEELRRL